MEIKIKKEYWCKCGGSEHPHRGIRNKEKHGKGELKSYIPKEIPYCCERMRMAWDEKFIHFGDYEDGGYILLGESDTNINIYSCNPYPEGACWDAMAIRFCPFCGEKIEVI